MNPWHPSTIQHKQEILPYIRRLQSKWDIPIIYISHSMEEILQLVDTLIFLKEGKVVAQGPANKVIFRSSILASKISPEILRGNF